jgi:hypothetical protein
MEHGLKLLADIRRIVLGSKPGHYLLLGYGDGVVVIAANLGTDARAETLYDIVRAEAADAKANG